MVRLLFVLLFFSSFNASISGEKSYLTPDAKINKNTKQLISKKQKQKKAQFQLGKIKKDIRSIERSLIRSQKELEQAVHAQKRVKHDLNILSKKEHQLNTAFKKRIHYLYKHSPLSIFDLMISNDNWIYDTSSHYFFSLIINLSYFT